MLCYDHVVHHCRRNVSDALRVVEGQETKGILVTSDAELNVIVFVNDLGNEWYLDSVSLCLWILYDSLQTIDNMSPSHVSGQSVHLDSLFINIHRDIYISAIFK